MVQRIHLLSVLLLAACTLLSVEAFSLAGTPLPLHNLAHNARPSCSQKVRSRTSPSMSSPTASEAALPHVLPDRGLHKTELGYVHYLDYQAPGSSSLPVVCLHMMPASAAEFAKVAPILAATHNRRVIAVDLLGYGGSDIPRRSCSVVEVADTIVGVCDALRIDRFSLAGSLTGSKVAVAVASRHPARVGALAVTHIYETPPPSGATTAAEASLKRLQDRWVLEEDGSHLTQIWGIRRGVVSAEDNQRKTTEHLIHKMNQRDMQDSGIELQPATQLRLDGLVEHITCPVLCVTGSESAAFYDSLSLGGANLAYAVSCMPERREELTIEGATTFVLATHPEEWAGAVQDFLSRAEVE